MKTAATLLLGTNLGDREANLARALTLLRRKLLSDPIKCSPIVETEACGFEGPAFLNRIVVIGTDSTPEDLLATCKGIEWEMGRKDPPEYDKNGRRIYRDRIIDIDILFFGEERRNDTVLTIPHPQVETRPFVRDLLDKLGQFQP